MRVWLPLAIVGAVNALVFFGGEALRRRRWHRFLRSGRAMRMSPEQLALLAEAHGYTLRRP